VRCPQAFEYLQLPFAIRAGTVGRLELQARRLARLRAPGHAAPLSSARFAFCKP
jgi:hypothetical protein